MPRGGRAPAHTGCALSAATRVAVPGFSSSTSSSTSRVPSRCGRAIVITRRAARTAGPVALVSYTVSGATLTAVRRAGRIGSEK